MRWAQLEGADLQRANLNAANLSGANLRQVNFRGAMLQRANLTSANLRKARLTDANLTFCRLRGARISRTPLHGANLTFAVLYETSFIDCDLSATHGLDECRHQGPSTADYRTLLKSRNLPVSFLRGCGLPDSFIESLPSWAARNEFATCFISYSTRDQDFADRLYADLQSRGVRCWFAPHNVRGGKKIHDQIDEAIRLYDRLLLILSDHSMNSEWVNTEIANARQREIREKRQMLFPISLVPYERIKKWTAFDSDTGKDSAREIREYFIPDFSNWKNHDSYQQAFQRLLRDLKAEGPNPPPNF